VLQLGRRILASALAGTGRVRVVRPLTLPRPTVAVGGATMGGSGKTPLAIACAAELASEGLRTALIGHAYRAAPARPRFVGPGDDVGDVGDEALVAARALDGFAGARVVVASGPGARSTAVAFAAPSADVLVLDGVAQTRPVRASLALLAVDAEDPWGTSTARPLLDLPRRVRRGALGQSPIAVLLSACDAIVPLLDVAEVAEPLDATLKPDVHARMLARFGGLGRPVWPATVRSRGAWVGQALLTWEALRSRRVGLVTALARPDRVVRSLERRGVVPLAIVSARDHGPLGPRAALRAEAIIRAREVDIWLATGKCALHAARALPPFAPLARLDHTLILGTELRSSLHVLGRSLLPRAP
jgi:tetraacyldisaccharide 4'-kinase